MSAESERPQIKFSKKIASGETPYHVSLDQPRLGTFLESRGVLLSDMKNVKVRITSKDLEDAADTEYVDRKDIDVSVSVGYAWKQFQKTMRVAEAIANGAETPSRNQFKKLLYTKRLPKYLQMAPKERGIKTAEKLLLNGVSREVNGSMLHELIHAADILTEKHQFWYSTVGIWISDRLDLARYYIDASERDAAKTEKRIRNNPEWRSILKIFPRPSTP